MNTERGDAGAGATWGHAIDRNAGHAWIMRSGFPHEGQAEQSQRWSR